MPDRFSDISTHWAKACILKLAELNIVSGFPDGGFHPDAVLTRAEFAALMFVAFPNLAIVRQAVYFPDVPQANWAYGAVKWGYERGLFSGYPDGYFKPILPIPRMQVLVVLVTALKLSKPNTVDETLTLYFDDATEIPDWTRWAIAAATLDNRIVNYPDVRRFRPTQNATRGDTAALLCAALNFTDALPLPYAPWNLGVYQITGTLTVPFERWKGSARLMRDIQTILTDFRLYPGGAIDGRYNSQTERALRQFCGFYGLNAMTVGVLDANFAWSLTHASPVDFILASAIDRPQIFNEYLAQEAGYNADKLAFLDRGVETSAYVGEIPLFPDRLTLKPDGTTVISLGAAAVQTGTNATFSFDLYPARGEQPPIDGIGLDFLNSDILQACVCIGSFVDGAIRARWLGKDALKPAQLWSSTKFLPLLNVLCQANAIEPKALIKDCVVCPTNTKNGNNFYELAKGLVNYHSPIASSNSIAATFKQFSTPAKLQAWVQGITGNYSTQFQGRYGEPPILESPDLWSNPLGKAILKPSYASHAGNNLLSTYDLARFMSLLGWHNHLAAGAQLPAARWDSLATVVQAMAQDTARYIDVAIERLGLAPAIASPVILSKLGFGRSDTRDRTELCYVAFVQFLDKRAKNQPATIRTVSLALLAASGTGDANAEARQVDARMAAEVTEILRRVVTQELV
jgi:peptidoglycan hydrolase-like protein with peptidoglycan-binding domain